MKMEAHSPHECEQEHQRKWEELYKDVVFVDDVHDSKELRTDFVIKARQLEMEFFKKMGVYEKVPRTTAKGHRITSIRWVDTNKGDQERPDYRSRLVGREIKKDNRLDLSSATPPLEAMKILVSHYAEGQTKSRTMRIHH